MYHTSIPVLRTSIPLPIHFKKFKSKMWSILPRGAPRDFAREPTFSTISLSVHRAISLSRHYDVSLLAFSSCSDALLSYFLQLRSSDANPRVCIRLKPAHISHLYPALFASYQYWYGITVMDGIPVHPRPFSKQEQVQRCRSVWKIFKVNCEKLRSLYSITL